MPSLTENHSSRQVMKKNDASVAKEMLIAAILGLPSPRVCPPRNRGLCQGEHLALGTGISSNTITNPVQAAFLDAFKADLARAVAFGETNKADGLPTYGRNVAAAGGEFRYRAPRSKGDLSLPSR